MSKVQDFNFKLEFRFAVLCLKIYGLLRRCPPPSIDHAITSYALSVHYNLLGPVGPSGYPPYRGSYPGYPGYGPGYPNQPQQQGQYPPTTQSGYNGTDSRGGTYPPPPAGGPSAPPPGGPPPPGSAGLCHMHFEGRSLHVTCHSIFQNL